MVGKGKEGKDQSVERCGGMSEKEQMTEGELSKEKTWGCLKIQFMCESLQYIAHCSEDEHYICTFAYEPDFEKAPCH